MEDSPNQFGDWLKRRRAALDLTQAALADAVGCSLITIQKLERGRRRASQQILARLAAALQIDAAERPAFLRLGRAQRREGAAPPAPAARTGLAASRLPLPLTPLIGREAELAALVGRLSRPGLRLLTLTGPAGIGKTRLALAAAAAVAGRLPDGAAFVPLAAITDPELLAPAIAHAIGEALPAGPPREALAALLRRRAQLLVLDNFEQLLDAAPELVILLQAAPGITMLITSRERLHLRGEQVQPLATLAVPSLGALPALDELAAVPAVALFCEVARAARPDFALTPANAGAVARLCARLDGLPLAIEIVAAQAEQDAEDLLRRLDAQLTLTLDGPRDLPQRQRTLWAAFDWSYNLLGAEARRVFARLGVPAAGWDAETAAALDPAAPAQLDALVRASLLQRLDDAGPARYALLQTVREFALEQLGAEATAVRASHAAHYLAVAEAGAVGLRGAEQSAWVARLQRDQANLLAALGWLLATGRNELAARMAAGLQRFWWMQGQFSEGRRWLERVLAAPAQIPPALLALLWHALGTAESAQGDHARATGSLRRGLAVAQAAEDSYAIGLCAHALGLVLAESGGYAEARRLLELGLQIDVESGDTRGQAISLGSLGGLAYHQRDLARARALFEESLALHRAVDDLHSVALTLNNLAELARRRGDDEVALGHLDEAIDLAQRIDGRRMRPYMLNNRALLLSRRGQPAAARAALAEALALLLESGDRGELLHALLVGARLWLDRGGAAPAATLIGAAEQLAATEALSLSPVTLGDIAELAGLAAGPLGATGLDELRQAGRALGLEQAAALASAD